MAKFEVTIYIEGYYTIEVEADNEDAAQEIAEERANISGLDYWEITESITESKDAEENKEDK